MSLTKRVKLYKGQELGHKISRPYSMDTLVREKKLSQRLSSQNIRCYKIQLVTCSESGYVLNLILILILNMSKKCNEPPIFLSPLHMIIVYLPKYVMTTVDVHHWLPIYWIILYLPGWKVPHSGSKPCKTSIVIHSKPDISVYQGEKTYFPAFIIKTSLSINSIAKNRAKKTENHDQWVLE